MLRFFSIVGSVAVALTLVQKGILSTEQAGGLLVAIVIAVALTRSAMKVLLPIFSIALFITYNASTNAEIAHLAGMLLALVIALGGLYLMIRKVFGKKSEDD